MEDFAAQTRPDFNRDLPSSPDVSLSRMSSASHICVTIAATGAQQRKPIHCIIVLDVSGSMDTPATQDDSSCSSGESRVSFSRLDLAKHSCKVVVEVMGDCDLLSIISFSSDSVLRLDKELMTSQGKWKHAHIFLSQPKSHHLQANKPPNESSTNFPRTAAPTLPLPILLRFHTHCPTATATTFTC